MGILQMTTNADSLCMGSNNQFCISLYLFLCKLQRIPKWLQAIKISGEEKQDRWLNHFSNGANALTWNSEKTSGLSSFREIFTQMNAIQMTYLA